MVYTILLDLCSVDIFCAVTGLYATFVGGVLRVFDEINLYIALNSFVGRVVLVIRKVFFFVTGVYCSGIW